MTMAGMGSLHTAQTLAFGEGGPWTFLTLRGNPAVKERARRGRNGRMYAPDAETERLTAWLMRQAVGRFTPISARCRLVCTFYLPDDHRRDTDNLIKHVCDAGNGVLWVDDSLIAVKVGVKLLDRVSPRTLIGVSELR